MNFKTTCVLLLVVAGVGGVVWKARDWAPQVGLAFPPDDPANSGGTATEVRSSAVLERLKPNSITGLTIRVPGRAPLAFKAPQAGQPLELPGNWPTRRNEVEELLTAITQQKSRFKSVPLKNDEPLTAYGLSPEQDPIKVEVTDNTGTQTLWFGEPTTQANENPFTRPAYVRINEQPEVLRLGPDVLPILRREADLYRKRQLFPDMERVKIAENSRSANDAVPQFLLTDHITHIRVEGPNGRYVLKRSKPTPKAQPPLDKPTAEAFVTTQRLADAWELVEPFADRVDPSKLKAILGAIPDLWVEQFLLNPDSLIALGSVFPAGIGETPLSGFVRGACGLLLAKEFQGEGPFIQRAGLAGPDAMRLVLQLRDGSSRSLVIGRTTKVNTKVEPPPPPMAPGMPPPMPKITEEKFYFAKLDDNPAVFEVRGEKLNDLFFHEKKDDAPPPMPPIPPPPKTEPAKAFDQVRDPNPWRFESDHVLGIRVVRQGQSLALTKTKGNPKAETEAARRDRWDILAPFTGLAEAKQVNDLLDPLERMAGKKGDIIDRPLLHCLTGGLGISDLAAFGLTDDQVTQVHVSSDPRSEIPNRTVLLGKHDGAAKKLFVMTDGEPNRITIVDDAPVAVVERQARAYRALKLFDLGDDRIESLAVKTPKETYRLTENLGATTTYPLVAPVAAETDTEKVKGLFRDLASLEAIEYVYDPLAPAESTAIKAFLGGFGEQLLQAAANSHGLEQPVASVTLNFAGPKQLPARTLAIGKARDGKPEVFARLEGSATVFAIKKEIADLLAGGSLAMLPLQLWNGDASGLAHIEVQRGASTPYTLLQTAGTWKLTAPFATIVDPIAVNTMANALAVVKAERYEAHRSANLADFGLDKPSLKVKFKLTERKVNKPGETPTEETKERVLLIGKPEADGKPNRFAKLDEPNAPVFVLSEASFKEIDKPALELLNKKLLAVVPSQVSKIESTGPDGTITLQKEGADWKPVGATFPVDQPTINSVLRLFSNLTAIQYADFGPTLDAAKYGLDPAAKPTTITLTLGTQVHKLELGKVVEGTPNDRYARLDQGQAIAVLPATTTRELAKGKLDFVERTLFKFDPIDLQAIRRTSKGQEFEATLDGTNWNLTKPVKVAADQQGLEELGERLSNLRAERVADVEGKDLAKYGLDQPTAILKLELLGKGGRPTEKSLKIGAVTDTTKPDGDRYVQLEGNSTIVVLSGPMAKRLLAEPVKFRERSLASFVTADKITITRDGKDASFIKSGTWKMNDPVAADAEDEAMRELHDQLARLRAEEIVAEKAADLKLYGLDKPERWRVFNGEKELVNLLVGSREKIGEPGKQKDGFRVYAKLEKSDLIVLLDMGLTSKLAGEYRKRSLWEPLDVAQAAMIEITTAEGTGSFKLVKGPLGWLDPTNPTERLDNAAVTDFLDTFAGLKAERFADHNAKDGFKLYGLDPARKTVAVTTQNGQKRVLLLGRLDESKRAYAKTDDPARKDVVLLSVADTEKVRRDRQGFGLKSAPEPKKEEPKKEPEPKKEEPKKKDEPKKE